MAFIVHKKAEKSYITGCGQMESKFQGEKHLFKWKDNGCYQKLTISVFKLEMKRFGAVREQGFWSSLGYWSSAHKNLTDFKMKLH